MSRFGHSLLLILLGGCAFTGRPLTYDRVRFPLPAYRRLTDRADGLVESRYGQNPAENTVGTVAAALISSGLSVAGNPDFFESDILSGRCMCRRAVGHDALEFPCSNITVLLVDIQGREVGRLSTGDGEFVFPVKKDERYHVRILSPKYYLLTEPELHRGDDIVLHLVQK